MHFDKLSFWFFTLVLLIYNAMFERENKVW